MTNSPLMQAIRDVATDATEAEVEVLSGVAKSFDVQLGDEAEFVRWALPQLRNPCAAVHRRCVAEAT